MKNTRRFLRQSICSLLALAFLWVAMPLSGFAAGLSAIAKDEPLHTAELGTTMSQEPLFLYAEDSESRGENTKVFYASDGSKTMVFYPSAVHYVKDGKFEEIDNTLALENGRLTTKNSPVEISLPVNFGAGTPVTYTVGGHSVSFVLQSA
ncbi:MAG: hypothetical protein IKT43_02915, partial [Clostridia bacterium]|nr:hypothetical protein [Clostridia bacterium]